MFFLQGLRQNPWLARVALLWLVLTLGSVSALPVPAAQALGSLCTASDGGADGDAQPGGMAFCPLCLVPTLPPDLGGMPPFALPHLRALPQAANDAPVRTRDSRAPPPARGPPVISLIAI
ncbi:MAG: hypothetical protein OHK0048_01220 [Rhodoferax sp.]